ncbi:MAG: CmpA/NrtA family ABC transporter substrate-binding protein [Hyphomicrobiaceae bacterium]
MSAERYGRVVRAGFVPLIDSSMLVVAHELGFATAEGLDLQLVREASWANIRDKIAVGHLDVAHMLAPLPIAVNLGLSPVRADLIAPMELGLGGNTVAISLELAKELAEDERIDPNNPAANANRLVRAVLARARAGRPRLVFAVVHPYSSHFYELAYWMSFAGIALYRDVDVVVLPPTLMADALAAGQVDGFCAGEPWGSLSVARGAGVIVTRKTKIWRSAPEKVLGVRRDWSDRHPDILAALMKALYRAALWCDSAQNRPQLVTMLAESAYLDLPKELLGLAFEGGEGTSLATGEGFAFSSGAATFPWVSHALWFYSQMVRWGQIPFSDATMETARRTYRPDLYRSALGQMGIAIPTANAKLEGSLLKETAVGSSNGRLLLGPDEFFDGRVFDPDHVAEYINGFSVHTQISISE